MNVDKLVDDCYKSLPASLRERPWTCLNHGYDVLDSTEKLNAYIVAYGEMHISKCRRAMQSFPFDELVEKNNDGDIINIKGFDIYDWGCGQGLGTLTFLEMLHEREILHGVQLITLIEPSKYALDRAEHFVKQSIKPQTTVVGVNRFIPQNGKPLWSDLHSNSPIAIHICSNILDIHSVGLSWLAKMTSSMASVNIYVCVGPQYGRGISRIADFHNILNSPKCFSDFSMYPCGYTTHTQHPYGIETKCFKYRRQDGIDRSYIEMSNQNHVDEYMSGDECLIGFLPDSIISTYHKLRLSINKHDKLFLKPTIGIERPDFIVSGPTKGILIINVCDDINKFTKEFDRVEAVKQTLIEIYIKSLKIDTIINPLSYGNIKTALFFTNATEIEINEACSTYYASMLALWEQKKTEAESQKKDTSSWTQPDNPTLHLLKLTDSNKAIIRNRNAASFRSVYHEDLMKLVVGSWHPFSSGDTSIKLTKNQEKFVVSNESRLRIRGVAGSGKTQVVAHKAVREHIRTGKKVLIVTYNITLIQYIKMRINQVPADFCPDAFEVANYHQFFWSKAKKYYGRSVPLNASDREDFFLPYVEEIKKRNEQYETIIVDEAQDFMTSWFDCLRNFFLSENGKFIIFGDGEQNVYNRKQDASTKMPKVNGFIGRWNEMSERISQRAMNPQLSYLASLFALKSNLTTEIISSEQSLNLDDYKIGYRLLRKNPSVQELSMTILNIIKNNQINPKDIVILAPTIKILREIECYYRQISGQNTMTTFEREEEYQNIREKVNKAKLAIDLKTIRRVAKVHFTTNIPSLKFATISSFKGWESKTVILVLQTDVEGIKDSDIENGYLIPKPDNYDALVYVGLTRARENLFVVNLGNEKYHNFFNKTIHNDIF